jgi:hypothetical protein
LSFAVTVIDLTLQGSFRASTWPVFCQDELVQNEVHALLFAKSIGAVSWGKKALLFTPYFKGFSAAWPYLLHLVNNQLGFNLLSLRHQKQLSVSELDSFKSDRDQWADDQPHGLAGNVPPLSFLTNVFF